MDTEADCFVREEDDVKGKAEVFGLNGSFASDCRALAELSASFRHFGGGPGGKSCQRDGATGRGAGTVT